MTISLRPGRTYVVVVAPRLCAAKETRDRHGGGRKQENQGKRLSFIALQLATRTLRPGYPGAQDDELNENGEMVVVQMDTQL